MRFRFAKSFKQLQLEGYAIKTVKTYSAISRLFLVYTAYEYLLPVACGLRVVGVRSTKQNQIIDNELSTKLRTNKKLRQFVFENTTDSIQLGNLTAFYQSRSDNITCVAYALRSLFAHGNLTTTDIGFGRAEDRKVIDAISDKILEYCDGIFSNCVAKL